MSIWQDCLGNFSLTSLQYEPWRVVEAQHILSSRDLVENPAEHDLLEEMIETTKPRTEKDTNYLIFTPFRYPPLKYGSRFGSVFEPSLWYGSENLESAFHEVAYYRFRFFADTSAELDFLEISMTAFTCYLKTEKGLKLHEPPFHKYTQRISHPQDYGVSQHLGEEMRQFQVEAFTYFSARTSEPQINIAAFKPTVFKTKKNQYISNYQTWSCVANKKSIEFIRLSSFDKERYSFNSEQFDSDSL